MNLFGRSQQKQSTEQFLQERIQQTKEMIKTLERTVSQFEKQLENLKQRQQKEGK